MIDVREALKNWGATETYSGWAKIVKSAAMAYAEGKPVQWCHYHSSVVSGSGKSAIPLVCDYGYAEDDGDACEIEPRRIVRELP